ncbi:hypothetical protein B0H14DRAFT_3716281 [Mycena olivaceomarginata]|nr:hypothetical protein B0H14DRAFT_3716281 [Mycena olivaceomarginata]
MPPRKVESLAEKVLRLESEAKVIRAELATYKAEKASRPRNKLIPRPDGQSGTSKGYQIQKAMGLGRDKKRYSRLSRIIRSYIYKYLDPHKTIQKQDPARFDKFKILMQKKFNILPVLRAHGLSMTSHGKLFKIVAEYKRQDNRAHGKGKSQPEIASREQEEKEEEEGIDSDSDADSDAQSHYGSDTADDLMEEEEEEEEEEQEAPPSPPKSRAKQVAVKNTARSKVQTDDETEPPHTRSDIYSMAVSIFRTTKSMEEDTERAPAPILKKAATAKNNKENTSPLKRKSETREEEDDYKELSRKKLKAADPPVGRASNGKPKITVLRIPAKCPRNGCDEVLPGLPGTNLTPYLQRLLEERQIQLDMPDKSRRTIEELEGRICARIRLENKRRQVVQHGRQMGWPLSLDLMAMVTFILGLGNRNPGLGHQAPELSCCVAFVNFVNAIGGRIHGFGRDGLKNFAPAQVYGRAG